MLTYELIIILNLIPKFQKNVFNHFHLFLCTANPTIGYHNLLETNISLNFLWILKLKSFILNSTDWDNLSEKCLSTIMLCFNLRYWIPSLYLLEVICLLNSLLDFRTDSPSYTQFLKGVFKICVFVWNCLALIEFLFWDQQYCARINQSDYIRVVKLTISQ